MDRQALKEYTKKLRRQRREAEKAYRQRLEAVDPPAKALRHQSDVIVQAWRFVHGTPPKARKRRQTMPETTPHDHDGPYTSYMRELIQRARQDDQTAMPELKTLLDDTPELWQQIGDLAHHVENAWIKLLAPTDLFSQDCVRREAERQRDELLGDDPTPIQRHLVERIIACWLQVQHAEMEMVNSRQATDRQRNFFHKRLESAQKQHLAAMKELVKICQEAKPISCRHQ